jgi:hypothetical protein
LRQLQELVNRRNAVANKRNDLLREAERLGTDIEVFDRQIRFADAIRVVESETAANEL